LNNIKTTIEIHSDAIKKFDYIQSIVKDEREQCLKDRRFYSIAGAQWEGSLGTFFENKPKIEVNKIHLSVIRIINEYRNNKVAINFTSKDGAKNDKLADICDGLLRADENDSNAEEGYDNGFEEAVGGGIGGWRLRNDYENPNDEEDEKQRIFFEPIYDADSSVFFDPDSKKQDKSDAEYCFVISSISVEKYEREYNKTVSTVSKAITNTEFDWFSEDIVYIAEYYKCETIDKTIRIFKPIMGKEERFTKEAFDRDLELETKLSAQGYIEVRQKKIKEKKVRKYILSGNEILEDCEYIAGNNIPIIMNFGKRWIIDNIERAMGHVRLAKDVQILSNIQYSKLAEISALSPVEKPIFLPEQIAGHENTWSEDNVKNFPYLLVNPITDKEGNDTAAGAIGYTKPPTVPPALATLLGITANDINEVLGNQQAAEKVVSNISGEAIQLIQDRLDMQTYIYLSNFAKAKKRTGEIWLSMAKDIFVEDNREMKVINKEGESSIIKLGIPYNNEGELTYDNDLSNANFSVNVDIGPATSSKKNAIVNNLSKALAASNDKETQFILSSLMIMNMEGEALEDIKPYFRKKLLKLGAVQPTKEEEEELMDEANNMEPSAEDTYLKSEAQKNISSVQKNEADTLKSVEQTNKIKAETVEILEGIERENNLVSTPPI